MDTVEVVRVVAETTIDAALNALREFDVRAALVDHRAGKLRLHMNYSLLTAAADGVQHCGQLNGGRIVKLLDELSEFSMDQHIASYAIRPMNAGPANRGMLFDFFPGEAFITKVSLTTRSEQFAGVIRSAVKSCRCSVHANHVQDAPPASQGMPCLGFDGGTMNCY